MKLIFDFFIPVIMIPIASIKLNKHCVIDSPQGTYLIEEPQLEVIKSLICIGVTVIGYFIAIVLRRRLYTMFYVLNKCLLKWNYRICLFFYYYF